MDRLLVKLPPCGRAGTCGRVPTLSASGLWMRWSLLKGWLGNEDSVIRKYRNTDEDNHLEITDSSNCKGSYGSALGYDITAFDVQMGIEPASVLCLGKRWRKAFPARDAENGALRYRKVLQSSDF